MFLTTSLIDPRIRRAAPSVGVSTYLATQAASLSPGGYVQLTGMTNLDWATFRNASFNAESNIEYLHKAVYLNISGAQKIRVRCGSHSGGAALIEYDEQTNTWSTGTSGLPPSDNGFHGWDHNCVDTTRNRHIVKRYISGVIAEWDGSSWSTTAFGTDGGADNSEVAVGVDYHNSRDSLLRFDDENGLRICPRGGSWSQLVAKTAFTGISTSNTIHYVLSVNQSNGLIWCQDHNGTNAHWRVNADNTVTTLASPPITLGCAGTGGRFSVYNAGTQTFVLADPYSAQVYDYNIATDTWTDKGNKAPLNGKAGVEVRGFVTAIPAYDVIMYVIHTENGDNPRAYLYRHA